MRVKANATQKNKKANI